MLPRSSTLFHFTRDLDTLTKIMQNGFWPRYCSEDLRWHKDGVNEEVAFPMVCFCDIPISRIDEHVQFYGAFGIGLTKEWALKNKLNPITYVSPDSPVQKSFTEFVELLGELPDGDRQKIAATTFRSLISFTKPIVGKMMYNGTMVERDFYQESEWRFVPQHENIRQHMQKKSFENSKLLDKCNTDTFEHGMLKFAPSDVKYIFVPSDDDIPKIISFIQNELDHFVNADLKILMSRVTSLENLSRDI